MDHEARQDEREGDDTTRRNQDPLKKILRRDVLKYQRTIFGQSEDRVFVSSRHGKRVWVPIVGTKSGMIRIEKAGRVGVSRPELEFVLGLKDGFMGKLLTEDENVL